MSQLLKSLLLLLVPALVEALSSHKSLKETLDKSLKEDIPSKSDE